MGGQNLSTWIATSGASNFDPHSNSLVNFIIEFFKFNVGSHLCHFVFRYVWDDDLK